MAFYLRALCAFSVLSAVVFNTEGAKKARSNGELLIQIVQ